MPRGRLSDKQIRYTQLVASGMSEDLAIVEAGYAEKYKWQTIGKLKQNKRIQERISLLKNGIEVGSTATRSDREAFWTSMMNDPQNSGSVRLEASKLLGKAQGDFIDRQEIKSEVEHKPVVLLPKMSPTDWENYWEEVN